jgi:hypothetical protein
MIKSTIMKKLFTLILLLFTTLLSYGQFDLSIKYTNYTEGQYIGYGRIETEFKVTNNGPTTLHKGDTILLAAKLNNKIYDMYLTKQDSVTLWKLTEDLPVGGTLTLNPGYLTGWQAARHPNFKIPEGTFTLTLMVYGVGLKSWVPDFSLDATPNDNKTTIIYKNVDLKVFYNNYVNNEVTYKSRIEPKFTIVNNGPVDIKSGETIYMRTRINNVLYSFALVPNDTTKYVLTSDFKVGDSIVIDPGFIDGALTAAMLGASTVDVEVLVYGVMKSSVHNTFRTDAVPEDNVVKVTYDPSVKDDLSIVYTNYTEGQYIGYGRIETEFKVTNNGPTTLHKGDTILLAVKFNNTIFDLYLKKEDSVTLWKLTQDIPVGGTLTLNPGYLSGHEWQYWLPVNYPSMPKDSFSLTLMVYGVGLKSWDENFSSDSNPLDNKAMIVYKNIDLAIVFDVYEPNEYTTSTILQTAFTITNNGPVTLKAGEKIYLQAKLNNGLYDLSLSPGDTTEYVLTNDLTVGGTLSIDLGFIDVTQTLPIIGGDTLQLSLVLHGLRQSEYITSTIFATDGDSTNNIAVVTYKPTPTSVLSGKNNQAIKAYPVPTESIITFDCSKVQIRSIIISDVNGKVVRVLNVTSPIVEEDLSDLSKGMYIYNAYSDSGLVKTDRIIVK